MSFLDVTRKDQDKFHGVPCRGGHGYVCLCEAALTALQQCYDVDGHDLHDTSSCPLPGTMPVNCCKKRCRSRIATEGRQLCVRLCSVTTHRMNHCFTHTIVRLWAIVLIYDNPWHWYDRWKTFTFYLRCILKGCFGISFQGFSVWIKKGPK